MSDIAKIKISVGDFNFTAEGPTEWIEERYQNTVSDLEKISKSLLKNAQPKKTSMDPADDTNAKARTTTVSSLATYLKEKDAMTIQTKRFLATADWLRKKGSTTLTTSMVTKALQDNQQKRLGNPADCLNQNVSRGLCEKNSNGFFITPEGLDEINSE